MTERFALGRDGKLWAIKAKHRRFGLPQCDPQGAAPQEDDGGASGCDSAARPFPFAAGRRRPRAGRPLPADARPSQARAGGNIDFSVRARIEAARRADREAEAAGDAEQEQRRRAQVAEQARRDGIWEQLQRARASVDERLPGAVAAEAKRRAVERSREQAEHDADWQRLLDNDPMTTMAALEQAFADNESPAAPLDCDGDRTRGLRLRARDTGGTAARGPSPADPTWPASCSTSRRVSAMELTDSVGATVRQKQVR